MTNGQMEWGGIFLFWVEPSIRPIKTHSLTLTMKYGGYVGYMADKGGSVIGGVICG
jgi:hypothetical protein